MQAIKFTLSGKTAFFKKPDVNVNTYFTYNNIHKIALLGLLGALTGLGGHIQQSRTIHEDAKEVDYPEFYLSLRDLKISIVPKGKNGYFAKKVQVFNNSVGYASKEKGGNLVVREQWLENPEWDIYILDDDSIDNIVFHSLKDSLLNNKCKFVPYLGKNDHPAIISNCQVVEVSKTINIEHIDSLFSINGVTVGKYSYDDISMPFFFKEISPLTLSKKYNFYEFEELCFTNMEIEKVLDADSFYKHDDKILFFY